MGIEFKTANLDGREISYTNQSEFLVQIGKGSKGSYKTRYQIVGNLAQAVGWYNGINIGNGYKKRLIFVGANKPLLARQTS